MSTASSGTIGNYDQGLVTLFQNVVQPTPGASLAVEGEARRILAPLRLFSLTCRAKGRIDAFKACVMLSQDPVASAQAYADALLRLLAGAFERPLVLHAPGSQDLSFDERWLAGLLAAAAREDGQSLAFLTLRSIPRHLTRHTVWLAGRLATALQDLSEKNKDKNNSKEGLPTKPERPRFHPSKPA
jgi:hypothetical protein